MKDIKEVIENLPTLSSENNTAISIGIGMNNNNNNTNVATEKVVETSTDSLTEEELVKFEEEINAIPEQPPVIPELKQHPLCKLMPKMNTEQYEELKEDIAKNGLLFPIILYGSDNEILDGWNRYCCCKEVGVPIKTITYTGDSPTRFVISCNKRRHLTSDQRATLAFDLLPYYRAEVRKEMEARKVAKVAGKEVESFAEAALKKAIESGDNKKLTKKQKSKIRTESYHERTALVRAAKEAGSTDNYLSKVVRVAERMPELVPQIKNGDLTIKEALNQVYHKKESIMKSSKGLEVIPDDDLHKFYNIDLDDSPIKDGSLDSIITDPLYGKEFLGEWHKLALFAAKKLAPGGVLVAVSGQSFLPSVYKMMEVEGLDYYWTCCVWTPGVSPVLQQKQIKTFWKPLLVYVKGRFTRTFIKSDIFESKYYDCNESQMYHKYGQSVPLFIEIMNQFCYRTENRDEKDKNTKPLFCCDPFLGGGTSAIAAYEARNKREDGTVEKVGVPFIGIERDTNVFNTAMKRINDYKKEKGIV